MAMNFWAIGYKYEEDVFHDFLQHEDTYDISASCLLPTYEMADQLIKDELSIQYTPVAICIETVSRDGVWSYSRGPVDEWDWEEDMEDEE
ncbi:hypothetical protein CPT_Mater66 [Bacillus phage Mater]|uniref:Uncharacterized protein n=1 Tax=Bacillus phage Mater TaxID=1540090 RepID=A0A0A0RUI4_9CAUD|nr:hypothetical protein CPT_Mater66 [Bacillus phage Mater]AIW03223.1 hypothetical protein CPT_Mater66 [Bacillus phage Mater]